MDRAVLTWLDVGNATRQTTLIQIIWRVGAYPGQFCRPADRTVKVVCGTGPVVSLQLDGAREAAAIHEQVLAGDETGMLRA